MTTRQLGWTLAFLIVSIAPFYNDIPAWPHLLFALTAAWRWRQLVNDQPILHSGVRFVWTLANAAFVFYTFGSFNGIEPGTSLLIVMASMKLLESDTTRDLLVLLFMSFFLILANFLFDQSLLWAIYSLFVVWVGLCALAQVNRQSPTDSLSVAMKDSAKLLAQALPLTMILFFLFPRVPGPFWALPSVSTGQTGLSESMEPGSISQLLQSSEVAFRAYFKDNRPARRELYWRGPVLENVNGRLWTPRTVQTQHSDIQLRGTASQYDLVLEPHQQSWLLALEMPDPRNLPRNTSLKQSGQLIANSKLTERRRVTLTAYTQFTMAPTLDDSQRQINLQAAQTGNPRARKLAKTWLEQTSDHEKVVDLALAYFNQQLFTYTLSPPTLGEKDAADEFLFTSRRGFCEHYASSFVLLMRYADIPARVVTGYMGGEYNPLSEHITVRQSDAHAWAEVWLDGYGWQRVDPTAAVAPERVESGIANALPAGEFLPTFMMRNSDLITGIRQAIDSINASWNNAVLGYDKQRQWNLLRKLGISSPNISQLILLMISAVVTALLAYAALLKWRSKYRPNDQTQRLYLHFLTRLNKLGVQTNNTEDATELAQRASQALPQLSDQINDFCNLYQQLRYGSQPHALTHHNLRALLLKIPYKWYLVGRPETLMNK